jgi:hypothetical protein
MLLVFLIQMVMEFFKEPVQSDEPDKENKSNTTSSNQCSARVGSK